MDKENFCHVNESTLAELSQAKWTLDGMRKIYLFMQGQNAALTFETIWKSPVFSCEERVAELLHHGNRF